MAYSDSGAYVYKDGVRRTDREDVEVFDDQDKDLPPGARVFASLSRRLAATDAGGPEPGWHQHSHHAVLGDGPVRLCGYKSRPELWAMTDDGPALVNLKPFMADHDDDGELIAGFGEWAGHVFDISPAEIKGHPHQLIALRLVEPDGALWTAHCGYLYGAGHTDRNPDIELSSKHWWIDRLAGSGNGG